MAVAAAFATALVGPVVDAATAAIVLAAGLASGTLVYLAGIKVFSINEAQAVVGLVLHRR